MAQNKRTQYQREHDLRRISDMYLQGKSQVEIAAELGVSQPQISYDLKTIQARWRTDTTINLDEAKQKELARLDTLERTYWSAWERSLDERTKTRTERYTGGVKVGGDALPDKGKASIEKETLLGVPAYLAGVQNCISERCKLLGLYAPVKQEHTGKDGDPLSIEVRHVSYRDGLVADGPTEIEG